MTVHSHVLRDVDFGVGFAHDAAALNAIGEPDLKAVIWLRQPLPSFQDWMESLDPARLPAARVILRPDNARYAVMQACDSAGTPDCPERNRFIDDVAALSEIFSHLMETPYLRLRLDVVSSDACRKFHIDAVTARLVCTYRGPGTQYGMAAEHAAPAEICSVPACSPFLMRGTRWPGSGSSRLVHRSPPIEGTGKTRLLLVLDPVSDRRGEA
ncbi:DUF1826 domain-containing protein [Nitratireductor sp. XY-223]|uniref:DUF1826 domain-containing protein n=1 Tax=Nitratireductor sp. XY-223 TaxID=2561926 RepID=UPI0010AAB84E|nr:DUF1826 domain-containing protein [Nitratireductor sp. XY-223]